MWFLVGGIVLLVLWLLEIGPVAHLHWAWVGLPFLLAVVWWAISDSMGLTQRRAIDKMEARKTARRERNMEALGLTTRREKRSIKVLRDQRREEAANPPPPEPPRRDPRM